MLYLGYVLLRYVLIYNLEVSFNFHLTFLQLNVIVHCAVKTVFYLTLGYFLRAPDNSNRDVVYESTKSPNNFGGAKNACVCEEPYHE